jgi:RimJ/RimL family protein N-acetyltransferase
MQIEVTPDLFITPFQPGDAPALVELLTDREVYEMLLRIPHPFTPVDAERWLTEAAGQTAKYGASANCAIRQTSGALIGGIGVNCGEPPFASHRAGLGYWLGRPYWGQGIMTVVVQAAIRHAFEQLELTKLTAGVFAFNHASCRVLEKCGFAEEGLLRSDLLKDGHLIDLRLFGLLR